MTRIDLALSDFSPFTGDVTFKGHDPDTGELNAAVQMESARCTLPRRLKVSLRHDWDGVREVALLLTLWAGSLQLTRVIRLRDSVAETTLGGEEYAQWMEALHASNDQSEVGGMIEHLVTDP